jgi:hypothetical protein
MTYIEKCGSSCIMIVISFVYYAALFRYETNTMLRNKPTSPCSETGISTRETWVTRDMKELQKLLPYI